MTSELSLELARNLIALARKKELKLGCAESCTGGLVAAAITEIPGSSDVFMGGIVSYANQVKHENLAVNLESLNEFGAVSEPVANEMARGACNALGVDLAVSVTGVAGPDGGSEAKPVGTVHLATCLKGALHHEAHCFSGDRSEVRVQAVETALRMLLDAAKSV